MEKKYFIDYHVEEIAFDERGNVRSFTSACPSETELSAEVGEWDEDRLYVFAHQFIQQKVKEEISCTIVEEICAGVGREEVIKRLLKTEYCYDNGASYAERTYIAAIYDNTGELLMKVNVRENECERLIGMIVNNLQRA